MLLCGDHSLYRAALRILVQTREDFRIVPETTCESTQLEYALRGDVDLVLMDHDLCPATPAQLSSLENLLYRFAPRPIVIVTSAVHPQACFTALRNGAAAIVLKGARRGDAARRQDQRRARPGPARARRAHGHPLRGRAGARRAARRADEDRSAHPREREIVAVACTGLTNKQIAEKLNISEATVRHHLGAIFSKLGVSTRSELAAYGDRHKLL